MNSKDFWARFTEVPLEAWNLPTKMQMSLTTSTQETNGQVASTLSETNRNVDLVGPSQLVKPFLIDSVLLHQDQSMLCFLQSQLSSVILQITAVMGENLTTCGTS